MSTVKQASVRLLEGIVPVCVPPPGGGVACPTLPLVLLPVVASPAVVVAVVMAPRPTHDATRA